MDTENRGSKLMREERQSQNDGLEKVSLDNNCPNCSDEAAEEN